MPLRWAIRALRCSSMTNTYSSGAVAIYGWLPIFGEAGLDCRIADADGGPVIEELAGSGVLCDGFQSGSGVVVNGLVLELADGTTIQQGFDSCIGSHDCIVARLACIGDVGCLTVKYA